MRLSRFLVLFVVLTIQTTSYAQTDSLLAGSAYVARKPFREKSSSILLGLHTKESKNDAGNKFRRLFLEAGLHRSLITDYAVFTHGASVEVSPQKNLIAGFKYGGWTNVYFASLGANAVYYTNFHHGSFVIRPEMGLGVDRFRFAVGFNAAIISNDSFTYPKENTIQLVLNVLLKRKLIGTNK